MITVAEARRRLGTIYQRKFASWAVEPFDPVAPVSLGLKPPTDRQAATDLALVASWLKEWDLINGEGLKITWETRRWPNSGTQGIPVRLEAASPVALARFLGKNKHWAKHSARAQRLLELQPFESSESAEFGAAVSKILAKVGVLADHDFDRVFDVLGWLKRNPASGLFPRQLPVAGIDSKWLERHATIVRPLHVALGGATDFGLSSPPKLYRVRFLDQALAPGGLDDLMAPSAALARLPIVPRTVLILENLQTLLSLPSIPGVVALHGAGYDVRWCASMPWVQSARVLYWGDLDADGLNILSSLRSVLPSAESVMMDAATLEQFSHFAVPDPNGVGKTVPAGLTAAEIEASELLRDPGGLRLEQERIGWAHALKYLLSALPSSQTL